MLHRNIHLLVCGNDTHICKERNCITHPFLIYSNKKVTSDFYGTLSINPVKMSHKNKPKCFSNVGHIKIGNYFILSSNHEGLLSLMCTQLFPLSSGS